MFANTREKGRAAEILAQRYLERQGLRLVENNYTCRFGDIDLVMRHQDTLVFVEVRYRKSLRYGSSAESVDWRKQQKLLACAKHYLQKKKAGAVKCRFDVMALSPKNIGESGVNYNWIINAFGA